MSAQAQTVAAVAQRGYLDKWTDGELLARQIVKALEELGELASIVETDDPQMSNFFVSIVRAGKQARFVFDHPEWFVGMVVADTQAAQHEATDLAVVLAVMAHALDVPDIMYAAQCKAEADASRGVRGAAVKDGIYTTPTVVVEFASGTGALLGNPPYGADDGNQ